jgi:uncharacterized protein (DUF1501 family)
MRHKRLLLVVLRGGLDGLHTIVPWRDPHYAAARGSLALGGPGDPGGVVDLDGFFGLHPALEPLHPLWDAGELAAVHATALPYRERSHFDAQDLLENGTSTPHGSRQGWLNRALGVSGAQGLAIGPQVPLVLRGDHAVGSIDPRRGQGSHGDYLDAVLELYAPDPLLGPALVEALDTRAMLEPDPMAEGRGRRRGGLTADLAGSIATLLANPDGPQVAVLDVGGWDTHTRQSAALETQLGGLAEGLVSLRGGLADTWRDTVVLAVSEFGRTVAPNGTGGTDHGTATVTLLAGGAVAGGQVLGPWPGLRDLHEGRDLSPRTDLRSVFKGVLRDHLGLTELGEVFPDSDDAPPLGGLLV